MVDVGARWVADGNLRLPGLVGVVLFADTILTFMVVGLANSANGKRDPVAILTFVLAYTAVLFSIVDLDCPSIERHLIHDAGPEHGNGKLPSERIDADDRIVLLADHRPEVGDEDISLKKASLILTHSELSIQGIFYRLKAMIVCMSIYRDYAEVRLLRRHHPIHQSADCIDGPEVFGEPGIGESVILPGWTLHLEEIAPVTDLLHEVRHVRFILFDLHLHFVDYALSERFRHSWGLLSPNPIATDSAYLSGGVSWSARSAG